MRIIETLQILLSIGVCAYSASTDLKNGTVANKVLFTALIPATLLNITYYGFFTRDVVFEYMLNVLAVSILAILFYAVHIWGGGDSKMLIFLALTMPARLYYRYGNEIFPMLSIVIFTFSFGYLYLVAHSVICALNGEESFKSHFHKEAITTFIKDYIIGSIYLSFLINIVSRVSASFYMDNQTAFLFVNVFVVMMIFSMPLFRQKWLLAGCAVADIVFSFTSQALFSLNDIWIYLVIALLFVLRQLIARYNYKSIPISEVTVGMIPSAANVAMMAPSGIPGLPTGTTEDLRCKLTEESITAIKKWYAHHKNYKTMTIVRKIPFAIFISMGYCLFIVLGLIK